MDILYKAMDRDLVVVGLAVATSPGRAAQDIPAHWQRFMVEQVSARIPVRADDAGLYCVYCDYQSDHRGAYTMLLGHAVEPRALVPEGLRRVRIPAGRYAQLPFAGPSQQAIYGAWGFLNERWDGRHQRRYIADFERYEAGAMQPDHVSGQIAIGVD